jgi:hypothetical protein
MGGFLVEMVRLRGGFFWWFIDKISLLHVTNRKVTAGRQKEKRGTNG